ncbi:hypothetical protein MOUN0_B02256 [Monosporozyma unispora]
MLKPRYFQLVSQNISSIVTDLKFRNFLSTIKSLRFLKKRLLEVNIIPILGIYWLYLIQNYHELF